MPFYQTLDIILAEAANAPSHMQLGDLKLLVIKPEIAAQFPSAASAFGVRGVARERREFWGELCNYLHETGRYTQKGIDHLTAILLDTPEIRRKYYAANCSRNFEPLVAEVCNADNFPRERRDFLKKLMQYLNDANRSFPHEWEHILSIFQNIPVVRSKYDAANNSEDFEILYQEIVRIEQLKLQYINFAKLDKESADTQCNALFTTKGLLGINFFIDLLYVLKEGNVPDINAALSAIFADQECARLFQEANTDENFTSLLSQIEKNIYSFANAYEYMDDTEDVPEAAAPVAAAASTTPASRASSTASTFFNKPPPYPQNKKQRPSKRPSSGHRP